MKIPKFFSTTEGKFTAFLIALFVILFGYYFFDSGASGTVKNVEINQNDHIRGAVNAKVTLVEFGDFQCPACGSYEPIVRQVMSDNKDILRIVFRQFPLTSIHQNSLVASKATEAASLQGKFWEMHDMLYDKQKDWSSSSDARSVITDYAKALGLDVNKFSKDMDDKTLEDKIMAQYKEGVDLGVQGTPTFFLNGKKIDNPQTAADFDQLVKQEASTQ